LIDRRCHGLVILLVTAVLPLRGARS
jgi:hypothetical protein